MAGVFKLYIIDVISSLVVFGLMGPEFENVKESWFLIMLFTDIPKVTRMAQFALTSSLQRRIPANVAVSSFFCDFHPLSPSLIILSRSVWLNSVPP